MGIYLKSATSRGCYLKAELRGIQEFRLTFVKTHAADAQILYLFI